MGIELELLLLLTLITLGSCIFGRFEIETPVWRRLLKWTIIDSVTLGLFFVVGHWALLVPLLAVGIGCVVHFTWCARHGIDPIRASPRERYYQLRGWEV